MGVEQMRSAIVKAYPGKKWADKVKKMSDNQVIAIYNRLLQSGKLR